MSEVYLSALICISGLFSAAEGENRKSAIRAAAQLIPAVEAAAGLAASSDPIPSPAGASSSAAEQVF